MPLTHPYEGPKVSPPRIGLVSSSETPRHADDRLGNGIEARFDPVSGGYRFDPLDPPHNIVPQRDPGTTVFPAFGIEENFTSSAFNRDEAGRYREAATRLLGANETFLIEEQFYSNPEGITGFQAVVDSAAVDVVPTTAPVEHLIAVVEGALAECSTGAYRSWIHVPVSVAVVLLQTEQVRREGNLLLTAMDNVVVAGRGYDGRSVGGSIPANPLADGYVYTTGPTQVHRSPITVTPDTTAEAMDRSANTISFTASRLVAVTFPPDACRLAVPYTFGP